MRKILGFLLFVPGAWGLIAPQANLGLAQLRWMSRYSFPGEALAGIAILACAYYFLGKTPGEQAPKEPPDR